MPCSRGMTACKLSCLHRAFVRGYQQDVEVARTVAENATGGYTAELQDWSRDHSLPQFRDYLKHQGRQQDMGEFEDDMRGWEVFRDLNPRMSEEQVLGIAMAFRSPVAVEGIRELEPSEFVTAPVHGLVAAAIKDLDGRGYRHDANAVSKLMTLRGQLQSNGPIRGPGNPSPARYLDDLEQCGAQEFPEWSYDHAAGVRARSRVAEYQAHLAQAASIAPGAMVEGSQPDDTVSLHAQALIEHLQRIRPTMRVASVGVVRRADQLGIGLQDDAPVR